MSGVSTAATVGTCRLELLVSLKLKFPSIVWQQDLTDWKLKFPSIVRQQVDKKLRVTRYEIRVTVALFGFAPVRSTSLVLAFTHKSSKTKD